jgi:poly-gamma-glutamate synthesis protein (capsule biosynthesis protein)
MVSDRKLAQRLIEAGATAVIGHHPHVLQPVEWMNRADGSRGLVAFSLGNLVSNQDFDDATGRKRDGVLLELVLERTAEGRAEVSSVEGVPIATENRLGSGKTRNVQPVLLDEEVSAVQERLDVLAQRDDRASKDERQSLAKRLALLKKRLARIGTVIAPAAVVAGRAQVPTHP